MRRAARATASGAMTVHQPLGNALDLERDLAAQATALDHSGLLFHARPRLARSAAELRWKGFVLRKRVRDLIPGGLRAREPVTLRLDPQLAIEIARRAGHEIHLAHD